MSKGNCALLHLLPDDIGFDQQVAAFRHQRDDLTAPQAAIATCGLIEALGERKRVGPPCKQHHAVAVERSSAS